MPPLRGLPSVPDAADVPPLDFDQVYRRHAGFVHRMVRRLGVHEAAVEDVMHDVFVVVQRRIGEFDGRASCRTWLHHLARGVVRNHLRGHRRFLLRLRGLPTPAPTPDPEALTERARAARTAEALLAALDPDKREILALADVEGFRGPEIAEALGIPIGTVYSRLHAARREFERLVAERVPTEAGR